MWVQTTGIATAVGVGGRRHRKRRRAEARRAVSAWDMYMRTVEWANREMSMLILGRTFTQ